MISLATLHSWIPQFEDVLGIWLTSSALGVKAAIRVGHQVDAVTARIPTTIVNLYGWPMQASTESSECPVDRVEKRLDCSGQPSRLGNSFVRGTGAVDEASYGR